MGWLEGEVALITGGGSGIGRAVALRYLAEGASVAVLGRGVEQLEEVVAAAGDLSDRVLPLTGDVRSPDDLHRAVDATVERFGKLDVLVPNAGIWDYHRSVTKLDGKELSEAFDEVFGINVKGYVLAVEAAWRELVATRGSIVMTLSNASFHTDGGGPLYTASKHACLGLLRQFAYELAPRVRVNGVAVGGMRTKLRGPQSLGLQDRTLEASFAKNEASGQEQQPLIPLYDSSVEPEDFTGPYVLLASRDNSGTVTGAVIPADGGIAVRGFRSPAGGAGL
ncbi:2,3-dihydroxy-2,3-dihydrophenylpropionate dehydrogenase [Streptomyces sp. 3213]|uniref:3-(cis-5,6-dihydroxycyclohexa-1, 3-dien-1-yl)propanoate dehydrogenase n=1 Tax=Streptomyces sp. 3213.3 TaxID=1855348 RepID=UPI00089A0D3D|nr:3-(cis-5,6-dihydroxycyclohexa-1,3-dien-1-yl)propanoate dehydrogenase [Streptomyces sp. 3213.3]SEE64125.1 2,3-dihydroxy-2,3-dihydrophenylpropionate dehydrogenase [Streptomyces sp. 3213] [Streptomyces sp. 3213.3]